MKQNRVNTESGNVLFLILIAVALFAALSYAVTSSTNSGGGDANEESALVNSAAVTQYPASIKTAILRMQVSKGLSPLNLKFDLPPFASLVTSEEGVFHPDGGGATYAQAPVDVMVGTGPLATNATGEWFFNYDFEIENVSTTAASTDGNEIIAFLPGITEAICEKINEELGITGIPATSATLNVDVLMDDASSYTPSTAAPSANMIGDTLGATALDGKPYGCFDNNSTEYVYYHVILER